MDLLNSINRCQQKKTRSSQKLWDSGMDPKSVKEDSGTAKDIQGMTGYFSGNCVCLPMHIKKVKAKNIEKFNKNKAMFEKLYSFSK